MTHRRGERRRCMDVLFVCIVALAPTSLWAAVRTSHGYGFDAGTIAGLVTCTDRGFIKGPRANVTLAVPDSTTINDGSPIHPGRFDLPSRAVSIGAMEIGTDSLPGAAQDTRHPPTCIATDSLADTPARGLVDRHQA
jgi:hypothetical protein